MKKFCNFEVFTEKTLTDVFLEKMKTSILLRVLVVVVGVGVGLFAFILPIRNYVPVAREDAEVYVGYFEKLESLRNFRTVCFQDGAEYELYPHTIPKELLKSFETMEKGTKLFLLVNPNSHCIAEIRTETEELLNFEISQQTTYNYHKGYIWIGAFMCIAPIIIILLLGLEKKAEKKETARQKSKKAKIKDGAHHVDTPPLRNADKVKKEKILLSANVKDFCVMYRRIRSVNELVINGKVYDEMKAVIEFPHNLFANIGDHTIEAGYSDSSNSYIRFDGQTIAEKKRLL